MKVNAFTLCKKSEQIILQTCPESYYKISAGGRKPRGKIPVVSVSDIFYTSLQCQVFSKGIAASPINSTP